MKITIHKEGISMEAETAAELCQLEMLKVEAERKFLEVIRWQDLDFNSGYNFRLPHPETP